MPYKENMETKTSTCSTCSTVEPEDSDVEQYTEPTQQPV